MIIKFSILSLGILIAWIAHYAVYGFPDTFRLNDLLFLSVLNDDKKKIEMSEWTGPMLKGTILYIFVYRLMLDVMHKHLKTAILKSKEMTRSPSQYTIMITNVPLELRLSAEEDFVHTVFHSAAPEAKIIKYTFAYDIEKHVIKQRKYMEYSTEVERILYHRQTRESNSCICPNKYPYCCCSCCYGKYLIVNICIESTKKELETKCAKIEAGFNKPDRKKFHRTRYAFVTFDSAEGDCLFFINLECGKTLKNNQPTGLCTKRSKLHYKGNRIEKKFLGETILIAKPPEPEDICWDKLSIGTTGKKFRRLLNWAIIILTLCGNLVLCTWITTQKVSFSFIVVSI